MKFIASAMVRPPSFDNDHPEPRRKLHQVSGYGIAGHEMDHRKLATESVGQANNHPGCSTGFSTVFRARVCCRLLLRSAG